MASALLAEPDKAVSLSGKPSPHVLEPYSYQEPYRVFYLNREPAKPKFPVPHS